MTMSVKENILSYLEQKDIAINRAEQDLGWSKGSISKANSISSDRLGEFVRHYSDLSLEWLMTGEGKMIKEQEVKLLINFDNQGAPYYNVDFIGGFDIVLNDQTITPSYYINFDPYNKPGIMWCNISGKSMEPAINNGDIIAIREVHNWQSYLNLGEIYAIVTANNMRTVKRICKGENKDSWNLVPINKVDFEPQEINKNEIIKVFEVLGCVKRF